MFGAFCVRRAVHAMAPPIPLHLRVLHHPGAVALWLVAGLLGLAFVVLSVRDYGRLLEEATLEHSRAVNFVAHSCDTAEKRERLGVADMCERRRQLAQRRPHLEALYAWLESWLPCQPHGCRSALTAMAEHLILAVALGAAVLVLLWCFCGLSIRSGRQRYDDLRYRMPTTGSAPMLYGRRTLPLPPAPAHEYAFDSVWEVPEREKSA